MISLRRFTVSILFVFSLYPDVDTRAQSNEQLLTSAWDNLQTANSTASENYFRRVLQSDSKSTRALIGLSYLYSWQHRYADAWVVFEKALQSAANPHALAYAEMSSVMTQRNSTNENYRTEKMFNDCIAKPDPYGILRAMAYSRLADHDRYSGRVHKALETYEKINAITNWALIGPFDNISGSGYSRSFDPELNLDTVREYPARFGTYARWFVPRHLRPDKWIDMERHFVTADGVFYAYTFVFSPRKQMVSFRVGTSGAFKAMVNDEVVLQCEDEFNNDLDTYICQTELQDGWNKVLVKLASWDISKCNFLLRVVDDAGNPLEGLRSTTDIHSYNSKPGAVVKQVRNPFELYFEDQIAAHPGQLENYILLADCYLRNDKGELAEITLRGALKRSPNSVLLLDKMMEAYIRNDKRDLVVSTLEKIWTIDSADISAIEYKCHEALNNKNYDEAERLVAFYEKHSPEEEPVIGMKLLLYTSRNNPAQALELLKSAYEKYPTNYGFVSGMAYVSLQGKRNYGDGLELWKKYLELNYTYDALNSLADIYNQMGDYSNWESYREKMLELSGNAPGYSYNNAKVFYGREDYTNAEKMVRMALQSCPTASEYHEMLGDIARKRGDAALALSYYKQALRCYPGYLKLRETIRELENKKPVFSNFTSVNIDSLVKTAPVAADFPDDESIVMLDDTKYVLYPEGSNESRFELLVRIFKQEGIDDWKELNLGSDVTIEKAVSIKAGGTELRADINRGQMVFKSLQEGDFVYIRWREYERATDRFYKHFNAKRYLNGKYPSQLFRFTVLAPKDYTLRYRVSNTKLDPLITSCDDGTVYQWKAENEAAVKTESSMPHLDVVGKFLEVSSIDSWQFIADWYYDVTNLKSKATYEIREKVVELLGDASLLQEDEIIRRVYQFVTDSIRYSYVPFRQSGGTPQKARDVLITKIGDCKDVATLGISMLSVAGIRAEYCLVKTNTASLETQLPSRDFDHVIVRVYTKSGQRFLDFTASNFPVGSLPEADVDAFSLLIRPGVKESQRLSRPLFSSRSANSTITAQINDQGDISMNRTTLYSGGLGALMRHSFRNRGKKDNDKSVTEDLSRLFPNVKLTSLKLTHLDTLSHTMSISESFDAPRVVNEVGNFKLLKMPWFNVLELDEAFSYNVREYPIEFDPGYDTTVEDISITVPSTLAPVELPVSVSKSTKLADYSVTYSFANNILRAKRVFVVKSHLIPPSDYEATKEFYNGIVKEDTKQILLGAVPVTGSGKKARVKVH